MLFELSIKGRALRSVRRGIQGDALRLKAHSFVVVFSCDGKDQLMEERVYESLAAHLHRLPAGFPRTPTGVEMRILRRLFNPEEAAIAQLLSLKPASPEILAEKSDRDAKEMSDRLEEMAKKGLIFRVRKGSKVLYMAAQFMVGIWEYHVNDLDPLLIRDMNEYLPYFFEEINRIETPQMRTIPIPSALSPEQAVMPYEEARRIVLEQEYIIVAPCICRKEHQMVGDGCDRPIESCLIFGTGAHYYMENGLGRPIDAEEALNILKEAERAGLVLQPSNSQKAINICTCCGCCCQMLKNLKRLPKPADHVMSSYFASVDAEKCIGCGVCAERCQMDAVTISDEIARIDHDRCIGCGLCVPTCPQDAIGLSLKPEGERKTPPAHTFEMYQKMVKERSIT